MRITNDDYTPLSILAEVLSYAPASAESTEQFTGADLSSHDYILAMLRERLEAILNSFERLGSDACETQGLDDKGVDLLMKFAEDGRSRRIGFQIKSNREADNDAERAKYPAKGKPDPESGLLKTLKRQAHEARVETKVDEWWVLPCFHLMRHKKRLAAINSHFKLHPDPHLPVEVVAPEKILGLLRMSTADVDAICTRLLCRDDEVLREARSELLHLSGPARGIVFDTFHQALTDGARLEQHTIFDASDAANKHIEPEILLNELQRVGYAEPEEIGIDSYALNPQALPGLCALYFEGRVRHQLRPHQADTFMWRLLDDIYPGSNQPE